LIPVLVLGGSTPTALSVIRIFARKGIPTYIVGNESDIDPIRFSRWFRPLDLTNGGPPRTLTSILESCPLRTAVLMPCSDRWVEAVAELPSRISDRFPSTVVSLGSIAVLLDKWLLAQAVTKLGLPHPRTISLTTQDDLNNLPNDAMVDYIVKPRRSDRFEERFGVKALGLRNREDAIEWMDKASQEGLGVVLQEYIPGPPTAHYFIDGFVDQNGIARALFARRRIRMYPRAFGSSTCTTSIPINQVGEAVEALLKLLRSVEYRGIFSAEFKRDERDGRFKVLEVNVRPWWYIEFAQSCGVDVCELAYAEALSQPLETISRYEIGRRCVYPLLDLGAFLDTLDKGPMKLFFMLLSWVGCDKISLAWDDPAPGAAEFVGMFRREFFGIAFHHKTWLSGFSRSIGSRRPSSS